MDFDLMYYPPNDTKKWFGYKKEGLKVVSEDHRWYRPLRGRDMWVTWVAAPGDISELSEHRDPCN